MGNGTRSISYIWDMDQLADIKIRLQHIKPELTQKYHVLTIGLFGSVVRKDFAATSDIDIIVDFDRPVGMEFIDLANYIEYILRRRVDLVSKNGIKQKYYEAIKNEIVYV